MLDWWGGLGPNDRRALAIFAVIVAGFVLLTIVAPGRSGDEKARERPEKALPVAPPEPAAAILDETGQQISTTVPATVERAALTFFASYVRFEYGRGSAGSIEQATPSLLAEIRAKGSNTALHRYRGRVREIRGERDGEGYRVVAQIADTMRKATYPLVARFEPAGGGSWRATELIFND
jgi:hypothetical protein